jgi:glycosyltransferase involved in cell wall biosynthesis
MNKKICHISTVHIQTDTRILHRECVSLVERGFDVHLIVVNQQSTQYKGVQVHSVQVDYSNRFQRMLRAGKVALKEALALDADLYHLHDPELLLIAKRLQQAGKVVVFDSHEHVPQQILNKTYLPRWIRPIIATAYSWFEKSRIGRVDGLVTATDLVRERFLPLNPQTVDVNNYPRLDTLYAEEDWSKKTRDVVYVGLINEIRGIRPLMDALALPGDWRLTLIGSFGDPKLEREMRAHPGWKRVDFLGRKDREEVAQLLAASRIGLVTFLPAPNHDKNQPNKLFEYMAAGLPIVGSHFPRWEKIVSGANCGVCVNPADPKAIDQAVTTILQDTNQAKQYGINARKAMEKDYNWQTEEDKLVGLYQRLLNS